MLSKSRIRMIARILSKMLEIRFRVPDFFPSVNAIIWWTRILLYIIWRAVLISYGKASASPIFCTRTWLMPKDWKIVIYFLTSLTLYFYYKELMHYVFYWDYSGRNLTTSIPSPLQRPCSTKERLLNMGSIPNTYIASFSLVTFTSKN